jgi:hypothetical protein
VNCTIVGNRAIGAYGAGGGLADCTADIGNCIIWDNGAGSGPQLSSSSVPHHSCVEDVAFAGNSNICLDPHFADAGMWNDHGTPGDKSDDSWLTGDHHLMSGSACIDAGDNSAVPLDSVDLDADGDSSERLPCDLGGSSRFFDDPSALDTGSGTPPLVDMGAYEYCGICPVFRFWMGAKNTHFYTIDEAEASKLKTQYSSVFTYEGTAFYTHAVAQSVSNTLPVHRFWKPSDNTHFYTIAEAEKEKIRTLYSSIFVYEGAVLLAYPKGQQPPGALPVYRFWKSADNTHFYTVSESEKNKLCLCYSNVYTYEGVAWYAYGP